MPKDLASLSSPNPARSVVVPRAPKPAVKTAVTGPPAKSLAIPPPDAKPKILSATASNKLLNESVAVAPPFTTSVRKLFQDLPNFVIKNVDLPRNVSNSRASPTSVNCFNPVVFAPPRNCCIFIAPRFLPKTSYKPFLNSLFKSLKNLEKTVLPLTKEFIKF